MKAGIITLVLLTIVGFFLINRFTKGHYEEDSKVRDQGVVHDAQVPDFKLLSHTGDSITNETFAGKVYVATFFFSECPDICPMMSRSLTKVQNRFAEEENLLFLSQTLDPKNDSIPVLKEYAKTAQAIPGKWHFARNTESATYRLAREGYKVVALKDKMASGGIDHSQKVILVDQEGIIRGYFDAGSEDDMDKMSGKIRALIDARS